MSTPNTLFRLLPLLFTHHSDMSARYVELASAAVSGDNTQRTFATPDGNALPRGNYMAFALSNTDIPSEAVWARIL